MLAADIPTRIEKAFADDAGSGKNVIPIAPQPDGHASYSEGFGPLNRIPRVAGGIPPFGQDMNGILYEISLWAQWQGAGGPVAYNSAFSTAIGGYPKGAVLASSASDGRLWLSTVDNNTANPDSGGAGWVSLLGNSITSITANTVLTPQQVGVVYAAPASAFVSLQLPLAAGGGGLPLRVTVIRTDANASNVLTLVRAGSDTINGLTSGAIPVGATVVLVSNGVSAWTLVASEGLAQIDTFTSNGTATAPWWARRMTGIVTGAGGGAARSDPSGGNFLSSGGGGAGGTAIGTFPVWPGQTFAVTAPAGGAGGSAVANAQGADGGTASLGFLLSATGGKGTFWGSAQNCPGGAPGVGIGGQLNLNGGYGGDGQLGSSIVPGYGGGSYWGGGARAGAGGGISAGVPGAGGGGNYTASGVGGSGGNSVVVVEWMP